MVKRYQKEMDDMAARQARDDKVWNQAIEAAAKDADVAAEYGLFVTGEDIRKLKREPKP